MSRIPNYRRLLNRRMSQWNQAVDSVEQETKAKDDAEFSMSIVREAQGIVQGIAQTLQQHIHSRISDVVTRCLAVVFREAPYSFKIKFEQKRGKTEAVVLFDRDGVELDNPLEEVGGGVIDVASLALRLSCILLSRPPLRRVLVLDEPFSNIRGKEYRSRTREMLLELSRELGVQIIINTDIQEYAMGTVIEFPNEHEKCGEQVK